MNEKQTELNKLKEIVLSCKKCSLYKTRTNVVFGETNPDSDIIFIGEAPGATEDKQGIPFCGAAGKFLTEMLEIIGLKREDVYIANTLKCRPPENRDPEEEEKTACRPFLEKQFEIINPKLVVLLGRHSLNTFLPGVGSITTLHGKPLKKKDGKVYLPLYHPAAALHNGALRRTLMDDFQKIPLILNKIMKENKETISQNKLI